uniref:Histone H2A n=1 Tax=Ornithorhynchus anatinus TaxID=9258 RepID=F7FQZ2_ORNAN
MAARVPSAEGSPSGPRRSGPRRSRSSRAQLRFSVSLVDRFLRRGRYSRRVAEGTPVFLAAVLEYLTAELLELAGHTAGAHRRQRIAPVHLRQAVRDDPELDRLFGDIVSSPGAGLPRLHSALLKPWTVRTWRGRTVSFGEDPGHPR